MQQALRWIFWGLVYLAVALTAMVVSLGMLGPYFSAEVRWVIFGVFLYGIALDAKHKAGGGGQSGNRPPSGGELVSSSARRR